MAMEARDVMKAMEDCSRSFCVCRGDTPMINGTGSVTSGDPLDLEYHGDKYDLATKRGTMLALRRNGREIRLTMDGRTVLALTDEEADGLAYNLACAALAAMTEPDVSGV